MKENPIGCKRNLAYIPDNPDLYEFMTGIQYLNFISDIFAVGAADSKYRIRHFADAFDMDHRNSTGDCSEMVDEAEATLCCSASFTVGSFFRC